MQLTSVFALLVAGLLFASCGGDSSSSGGGGITSSAVKISGKLNLIGSSAKSLNKGKISVRSSMPTRTLSSTATDYCLACVTFEASPKSCPTSNACDAIAADGTFELSCDSFKNKNYGCFLYKEDYSFYKPLVFAKEEDNLSSLPGTTDAEVEITLDTESGEVGTTVAFVEPEAAETSTDTVIDSSTATAFEGTFAMSCPDWAAIVDKISPKQLERFRQMGVKLLLARACLIANGFAQNNQDNPVNTCYQNSTFNNYVWSAKEMLLSFINDSTSQTAFAALLAEHTATADGSDARLLVAAKIGYFLNCYKMGGGNGNSMYFHPTSELSTDGSYSHLGLWETEDNFQTCGSVEKDFAWKFSDGTDTKNLAVLTVNGVTNAMVPTTNKELVNNLALSLQGAINQWFPVLDTLGKPATTKQVTSVECKYVKNWPNDFWNSGMQPSSATYGLVWNGTTTCSVWNGSANETSACVYPNDEVALSGYAISKNANGYMEHTAIANQNTILRNQNVEACFSWYKFWNSSENPIIKKGALITECEVWGNNGTCTTERKQICGSNNFSTLNLVPNASGRLEVKVGATVGKYDLVEFGVVESDFFRGIYDQICKTTFNDASTLYQQYPTTQSEANITTLMDQRYNSKGDEGKKFAALYSLLFNGDGIPSYSNLSGNNFYYYNPATNNGSSVACSAIAGGTALAADILQAFQFSWGGWDAARLFICVLEGLKNGHYYTGHGQGVLVANADDNFYDGYAATLNNLQSHSCVPDIKVGQVCKVATTASSTGANATSGSNYQCESRAFCAEPFAELGGCERAVPTGRGPLMTFKKLADGIYEMFAVQTRVNDRSQYSQCTNPNYQNQQECVAAGGTWNNQGQNIPFLCTEFEQLAIRTTAVTMSGADVASFSISLDSENSNICKSPDGIILNNEGGSGGAPPVIEFTRI